MDWNKGFSATYYATFVDPITWEDIERFEIVGGSIDHQETSLLESASIDAVNYEQSTERWVRIYLDTRQGGASDHVALFTGLAVAPEKRYTGNLEETPIQCYSVLKPAEDILLPRGWYCPAGKNGAKAVQSLLSVTKAPVVVDGVPPTLSLTIIAEENESYLTMAWKILLAINWRLRISGDGTITICPKASRAIAFFDPTLNDSIEPQVTVTDDWFSVPNVFRAVESDNVAVARDEREDSPFSIQNRGREVWKTESNATRGSTETLAQYAKRRLKEEQAYAVTVDYDRAYRPDLYVGDVASYNYPVQGVVGNYVIQSQNITLGYGATVSEKVKKL